MHWQPFARVGIWTWLVAWPCSVLAQGQGSYGGIAGGFITLALIAILIVLAAVLLIVRATFGQKAVLVVLATLATGYLALLIYANVRQAMHQSAYKQVEREFISGCAKTTREILRPANGNEPIYIRMRGEENVPVSQHYEVLPYENSLGKGVRLVSDVPRDATDAVVVNITFSRDTVPGSYKDHQWLRTKYDLTVQTVPEGKILARTMDMEARNGFCLGELDTFLQKALNRAEVLRASSSNKPKPPGYGLPDAYVHAQYTDSAAGIDLASATHHDASKESEILLTSKGCHVNKSNISQTVAQCGIPDKTVDIPIDDIIGIHKLPNTWLFIYRVFTGTGPLTSLRVEQRLADWRLARVWRANAPSAPEDMERLPYLGQVTMDGETMNVVAYWGDRYERNAVLKVPLPGVRQQGAH